MPTPPQIWSDTFLKDEIREQPEYRALVEDSAEFDAFVETARRIVGDVRAIRSPDEQLTIERAITPLLEALGWPTPLPKRSLTSRDEIDLALYADEAQRELSLGEDEDDQVLRADGIVECKEWGRSLDGSGSGARPGETAAQQLQRYLLIAGTDSRESLRWGILTNGARWRIYSYRVRPRDRTWEVDLEQLLISRTLFDEEPEVDKLHELRLAWLFFRRQSWIAAEGARDSFLDRQLEAGRRRDAKVADDLSDVIFNHIYPDLVRLFWSKQPDAEPDIVARAVLTFLYRLLFIYYAEDRGMLDAANPGYGPHSLRRRVRDDIVEQGEAALHSTVSTQYWQRLKTLRAIIDQGDPSIGQPPYNGGLFAADHAVLDEIELSDAELAPIIRQLSHTADKTYISYRDLEVQQLGSIYERLLERVPQRDDDGNVVVAISPYARKDSGSYYTPQELVDLIVKQTLTPLVEERIAAFRNEPTEANDPAAALLELKILDPAMGSGHFLITALDWLTAEIVDLLDREWENAPGYVSPVRNELDRHREFDRTPLHESIQGPIRDHIEARRAVSNRFDPPRDEVIIQRMVLKRCLYGVDKNDMAVELAKVALWLHTFNPPYPLPYISHRIRAGDSLLGIAVDSAVEYLKEWGPGHMARGLWSDYHLFEQNSESDEEAQQSGIDLVIEGVEESSRRHEAVVRVFGGMRTAFDLIVGLRWLSMGITKRERRDFHEPLTEALSGHPARAVSILYNGESNRGTTRSTPEFRDIRDRARQIVQQENVVHWELEFPQIMIGGEGGFDAVITNPPWDRIKLQEVEWWAARKEEVANAPTAAARKRMITALRDTGDPLVAEYDLAAERATQLSAVFRKSGDYPLLGKGDLNLYSLFVERALALLNPTGIAGILTPPGIFADETASEFFRDISTKGRLRGLFHFMNARERTEGSSSSGTARLWFPSIGSNLTFCAFIAGARDRTFPTTTCGFFLNAKADADDPNRVFSLGPDDFKRINPNTATAPMFRTVRDAELVRRIYSEHPVLGNHSLADEQQPYNVRYHTMFHMTNASSLFRTATELNDSGHYRVAGHRYRRGDEQWVPLYQGRMIQAYDHRAMSYVETSRDGRITMRPSVVSLAEHADPEFVPTPQFWVPLGNVEAKFPSSARWAIGFRNVGRATDGQTVIATIVPRVAFGNSIQLLLADPGFTAVDACCLAANLSIAPLQYVSQTKVHGPNINWYILEQLPVIAPADYERTFGGTTARELVRDHVLRLTYTAHDLAPFARDLGYGGDPYIWDPAERRQLRARLDALYFHLYGLDEDDTAYVLDQFPVLEKNERRAHGRFLSKELVLGQYRALAASDTASEIRLD